MVTTYSARTGDRIGTITTARRAIEGIMSRTVDRLASFDRNPDVARGDRPAREARQQIVIDARAAIAAERVKANTAAEQIGLATRTERNRLRTYADDQTSLLAWQSRVEPMLRSGVTLDQAIAFFADDGIALAALHSNAGAYLAAQSGKLPDQVALRGVIDAIEKAQADGGHLSSDEHDFRAAWREAQGIVESFDSFAVLAEKTVAETVTPADMMAAGYSENASRRARGEAPVQGSWPEDHGEEGPVPQSGASPWRSPKTGTTEGGE